MRFGSLPFASEGLFAACAPGFPLHDVPPPPGVNLFSGPALRWIAHVWYQSGLHNVVFVYDTIYLDLGYLSGVLTRESVPSRVV